jgi:hypothetical protein
VGVIAPDAQQFVHILGPKPAGSESAGLPDPPTAKADMSFLTFPWHIVQFTSVSWFITILSKV